jgi:hypothetical protein
MTTETAMVPMRDDPHFKRIMLWLAGQLNREPETVRAVQRISLRVAQGVGRPGMRGDEVASWHRDDSPDLFNPSGAAELTSAIFASAEGVATSPGDHRFSICLVDRCDQKAFQTIVVTGEEAVSDVTSASGAAVSLLAQTQRHLEATQAMHMRAHAAIVDTLSDQLHARDEENKQLRAEISAMRREVEEARDQSVRRDIEAAEAAGREKRKDDAIGAVLKLAPVVANRIAGQQILPAGNPRDEMLANLSRSLSQDPARLQRIAAHLKQEEVIALLELMRSSAPPETDETANDEKKAG